MMDKRIAQELLPDYVRGLLQPEQARLVEQALAGSEELTREKSRLQAYFAALDAVEPVTAPPDFINRVNRHIDRPPIIKRLINALLLPLQVKIPLELAGAAACAIVLVVVLRPHYTKNPAPMLSEVAAPAPTTAQIVESHQSVSTDNTLPEKPAASRLKTAPTRKAAKMAPAINEAKAAAASAGEPISAPAKSDAMAMDMADAEVAPAPTPPDAGSGYTARSSGVSAGSESAPVFEIIIALATADKKNDEPYRRKAERLRQQARKEAAPARAATMEAAAAPESATPLSIDERIAAIIAAHHGTLTKITETAAEISWTIIINNNAYPLLRHDLETIGVVIRAPAANLLPMDNPTMHLRLTLRLITQK
jgi:hypothetical protein